MLTCVVENMSGLSDIKLTKGDTRTTLASLASNFSLSGVTIIQPESTLAKDNGVLKINMTVKCGDGGNYYCSPVGTGKASEDLKTLVVQCKSYTAFHTLNAFS